MKPGIYQTRAGYIALVLKPGVGIVVESGIVKRTWSLTGVCIDTIPKATDYDIVSMILQFDPEPIDAPSR